MQFGKQSDTTLSTVDELQTPNSNSNAFGSFNFDIPTKPASSKPVEGPVGPHLFRISQETSQDVDFYLSMASPISPEQAKIVHEEQIPQQAVAQANRTQSPRLPLRLWTPGQVADWMQSTGFDDAIVETFFTNDISGATLIDLQYDDLKELGVKSFGQRHRLWNEIRTLRGSNLNTTPSSPVDDGCNSPTSPRKETTRRRSSKECASPDSLDENQSKSPTGAQPRTRRARRADAVISPAESASIVAIEQLLPKPHTCSKGENCSKWQRQQRKLEKIAREFPIEMQQISDSNGSPTESGLGPTSVVVPSVVASSDLLGPAQPPVRLDETVLSVVQSRDPQENVRQFLSFQHIDRSVPEEPTTPPYEMFPPLSPPVAQTPHSNLRSLPKLTIPVGAAIDTFSPNRTAIPHNRRYGTPITAMEITDRNVPYDIYRFGSPASEMDVPTTAIPLGPIERDVSSSVPPDMRYGAVEPISRSTSRLEHRRPPLSFAMPPPSSYTPISRSSSRAEHRRQVSITKARIEENHPLSPIDNSDELTPTIPNVDHAGWMKKRKTKMLRHEWHENHFRLNGTRLAMHRDEKALDMLEYIDVDDYAVACSSLSSSKLNAAFKSLKLSGKKKEGDPSAFAFQLVPAAEKKGILSSATGKTHHFAVKTRDERIDWMRELMLAKALKQKGDGYEVNLNGNMI